MTTGAESPWARPVRLDADGNLTIDLTHGTHDRTKAAIRGGSLVLTDPDGTTSTFKRDNTVLPGVPGRVATPTARPKVPIHGWWVSTEFAREVMELSPLGGMRLATRGESAPLISQYDYAGDSLRFVLNMPHGTCTMENQVTSLRGSEMMIFLPALMGLREARSVTYWRIDTADFPPRTKILETWWKKVSDGILVKFAGDDTPTLTTRDARQTGILRVIGQTLEYHTTAAPSVPVARMKLVDVTDRAHVPLNPSDETEQWEDVRVK